jgi:hypothetical protein
MRNQPTWSFLLTDLPHEYGKRSAVEIFFRTLAETHRSRSTADLKKANRSRCGRFNKRVSSSALEAFGPTSPPF